MTQVIIIGAGPTGATLALLLAKSGITVKLIEASRSFRRFFRGEGLMPSGLNALEEMGLSSILNKIPHRPLDAWKFIIENRQLFKVEEPIESGGKPCTLVSQPPFLEAVIEEAKSYPNFELIQGTGVQDLLWENQRVCGVRLSDEILLDADLVIGADGRNSIIRQRANLTIEEQFNSFDILWFKLADNPIFESENVFYSIAKGVNAFGLFRSSEGNIQVGWALNKDISSDWKHINNWAEILASASPPWLAEYFRKNAETIERPVLLSVVVGRCLQWYKPGLILLGDAAHPMSPIRAQGINMALRDVIVAANYLLPILLNEGAKPSDIDEVLPKIQEEREIEIIKVQKLQNEEGAQAQKLTKSSLLRWAVSRFAPLISSGVRLSWLRRQHQLRQGVTQVKLNKNSLPGW
jgi:2-polyprenyl-6-methoxyphenol hydroxylase-like FAD-dependent oxidoreductase